LGAPVDEKDDIEDPAKEYPEQPSQNRSPKHDANTQLRWLQDAR